MTKCFDWKEHKFSNGNCVICQKRYIESDYKKKDLHKELIEAGYEKHKKGALKPSCEYFYQKCIKDKIGEKYYINCRVYNSDKGQDSFEFDVQLYKWGKYVNIETVMWFWDPEEKRRKYPTLNEVEDMFKNIWVCLGSEYHEKFYT